MKRIAFLVLAMLAACGGGGADLTNGERATQLVNSAASTYDNFIEDQNPTLLADIDELTFDTPVQYSGALSAFAGEGTSDEGEVLGSYLGELELTADFELGTISGDATNFVVIECPCSLDSDLVVGGDVTGMLTLAGNLSGEIEALYDITVDGHLHSDDGSSFTFDETGGFGGVYGSNAEAFYVYGETEATVNGNPGYIGFEGVTAR